MHFKAPKMSNFFEELKKYFEATPEEKILEDWLKSADFDNVGPSVEEYLQHSQQYYVFSEDPVIEEMTNITNYSPKFSSGFFLTSNSNLYA